MFPEWDQDSSDSLGAFGLCSFLLGMKFSSHRCCPQPLPSLSPLPFHLLQEQGVSPNQAWDPGMESPFQGQFQSQIKIVELSSSSSL